MTWHFLVRDFRDLALGWAGIAILTIIAILFGWGGVMALFGGYFFFLVFGEQHVIGSTVRNQHILSRHYLLSLPCSHKRLFGIQQIRMLVFYLPVFILMYVLPFRYPSRISWPLYLFALIVTVAAMMHWHLWSALESERIASYLPKRQRLWAYIKVLAVSLLPIVVIAPAWMSIFMPLPREHERLPWLFTFATLVPAEWIFVGLFFLLIFLIPLNARRWCVTL